FLQTFEKLERVAEAADAADRGIADHRRLARVLLRQQYAGEFLFAREQRSRQRALDRLDASVEREFAQHQVVAQKVALEMAGRRQDSQRDRQIEGRAFLARI